jgi:CheY-like chemotaxis protein
MMTEDRAPGRLKVLVVEDAELVRESTVLLLEGLRYEVLAAENGPEALRMIDGASRIDLLLSDVLMPGGIGGQEIVDAAVKSLGAVKVLLCSASPRADLLADGRIREDTPLLTKPYRGARLKRAIDDLFGVAGA